MVGFIFSFILPTHSFFCSSMSTAMPTKRICSSNEEEYELRKGPWTLEEDTLLIHYITYNGEGRWNLLAKCAGLKRTGKSCRLRWLNYLKPDIKRGNLTPQEQILILELHSKLGNRWSKIAQHLPGRTDNEIKNYWRTRVQKQARQLKIDSNSKRFLETLRQLWMPRLLQQTEQSSSSSSSSNSTMATLSPQPNTLASSVDLLKNKSNSSICSSDSATTFQFPENSQHPTSPAHGYGNTNINSLQNDCYYVDINNFDMEVFNQPDMSAVGSDGILIPDCQMAEIDWMSDDGAGTFWNMDELWQFRKVEG